MKPLQKIEPMELVNNQRRSVTLIGYSRLSSRTDFCKLLSRNEYDNKRFRDLAQALLCAISAKNVADGRPRGAL